MSNLMIRLVSVTNLTSGGEMSDEADPYVQLELMQDNALFQDDVDYGMKQSSKKKDVQNPVYNEMFQFDDIDTMNNVELKVTIMDDDVYSGDDRLGRVTINLEALDLDPEPMLVREKVCNRMFQSDSWITFWFSWGEPVKDDDADELELSHVGSAAYEVLRKKHPQYHNQLWNVTHGKVVGELHQTPLEAFRTDHPSGGDDGHDDWFPQVMADIISRTERWCDVLSLGPPDGIFMDAFKSALSKIAESGENRDSPVTIRMCFGNIPAMPVNCTQIIEELTDGLDPSTANIKLWVGAWRRVSTWNHAKIIAVDGRHLHTGGHNMWDPHYLKYDPVHDLSLELKGAVAIDGHNFANEQWGYIEKKQETLWGGLSDKLPDGLPQTTPCRVTISEWPKGIFEYPPTFRKQYVKEYQSRFTRNCVPIITMGRYGSLLENDRPSDDAFVAMLGSAERCIRMVLQDLGPVCFPKTKRALPGLKWPKEYLSALARVIWEKGVDVEIVLSNPNSIPGGLSPLEANYGNGWTCEDVASEIIKTIREQFPNANHDELRSKVSDNLRICFLRHQRGNTYENGMTMGLHSKHFIIDDTATYIGSQNLYVCDLAEWGVVIDDKDQTQKIMDEYFNPLWACSYTGEDVDVDVVMDGLDIDRNGDDPADVDVDDAMLDQMEQAQYASFGVSKLKDAYEEEDSESSSDESDGSENSRKARRRRRKEHRREKRGERRERRRRRRN